MPSPSDPSAKPATPAARATRHLLGVPLRRPGPFEVTAAAVLATGLWVAAIALARTLHLHLDRVEAGALLLVLAWACMAVRLGIRIERGSRHLLAYGAVNALLLGLYQAGWAWASS